MSTTTYAFMEKEEKNNNIFIKKKKKKKKSVIYGDMFEAPLQDVSDENSQKIFSWKIRNISIPFA